jgi:phospholipid N-methyltransferase
MSLSKQKVQTILKQSVNSVAAYLHFFWAGLVKHGQTGGIVPSQRFLIAKMIAPVPETYRGQVIELGAGNGALTVRLALRCPAARILACEINPTLARDHGCNLAAAGLNGRVELFMGSAANLLSELGQKEKPDFVISGIPLGNLGREKALALVETIHRTLAEGGMYIQLHPIPAFVAGPQEDQKQVSEPAHRSRFPELSSRRRILRARVKTKSPPRFGLPFERGDDGCAFLGRHPILLEEIGKESQLRRLQPRGVADVRVARQWLMMSRTPVRRANHTNC